MKQQNFINNKIFDICLLLFKIFIDRDKPFHIIHYSLYGWPPSINKKLRNELTSLCFGPPLFNKHIFFNFSLSVLSSFAELSVQLVGTSANKINVYIVNIFFNFSLRCKKQQFGNFSHLISTIRKSIKITMCLKGMPHEPEESLSENCINWVTVGKCLCIFVALIDYLWNFCQLYEIYNY